ncbi:Uu.00g111290.m01.CDS01 [Anthostomella pinea]|uniref:Uu.00g111290.m01.CDS01 n=1 Tax=Anthostomella pinea TaxID=933095 RepID=A0AAI8YGD0_9PEZI|nr:Uu.00g111290.m01.CDS01 [Anthostomella pinea]
MKHDILGHRLESLFFDIEASFAANLSLIFHPRAHSSRSMFGTSSQCRRAGLQRGHYMAYVPMDPLQALAYQGYVQGGAPQYMPQSAGAPSWSTAYDLSLDYWCSLADSVAEKLGRRLHREDLERSFAQFVVAEADARLVPIRVLWAMWSFDPVSLNLNVSRSADKILHLPLLLEAGACGEGQDADEGVNVRPMRWIVPSSSG